jgi:hypothetical protein
MIKEIYKINSDGIYEDVYLANLEENSCYNGEEWIEIDFDYVEVKPPHAKVVRWDGSKWIVIEEYPIEPIEPQPPTVEERLKMAEDTILFLLANGGI